MIIQTSAGHLYRVTETNDPELAHVWFGTEVKRAKGEYVPKKNARKTLVRKEASRMVEA